MRHRQIGGRVEVPIQLKNLMLQVVLPLQWRASLFLQSSSRLPSLYTTQGLLSTTLACLLQTYKPPHTIHTHSAEPPTATTSTGLFQSQAPRCATADFQHEMAAQLSKQQRAQLEAQVWSLTQFPYICPLLTPTVSKKALRWTRKKGGSSWKE